MTARSAKSGAKSAKPLRCGGIFAADGDVPPDPLDRSGLRFCVCGLQGKAGDAHHTLPPAGPEQDEHRRWAGEGGER